MSEGTSATPSGRVYTFMPRDRNPRSGGVLINGALPAGEGRFVTPFLSRETAVSLKRRFAPRKTLNGSLLQVYICDVSDVTSIPHLR